jgi:hypothetical protein
VDIPACKEIPPGGISADREIGWCTFSDKKIPYGISVTRKFGLCITFLRRKIHRDILRQEIFQFRGHCTQGNSWSGTSVRKLTVGDSQT